MSYDPNRPVTVANCPTREALEKQPKTHGSIGGVKKAANAMKKRAAHLANVQERGEINKRGVSARPKVKP